MGVLTNLLPFVPYAFEGEAIVCPLCGSAEARAVCQWDRRIKPLRTVVCEGCGLLRTDPMPTAAELTSYYATGYRLDYQGASRRPPRRHLLRSTREAEARFAVLTPALQRTSRVLDFGSGSGEFLDVAQRAGHDVIGIEPGDAYAAHAAAAYQVRMYPSLSDAQSATDRPFDVITASHVLEHLRDPVSTLRDLAGLLAPDGVIHVAVPNFETMGGPVFERFHFAHVYNFTPTTLIWAGVAAGLEPDPRFPNQGTEITFRKRPEGPGRPPVDPAHATAVAARCHGPSPAAFLLSGRWLVDAAQRLVRDARDTVRYGRRATIPSLRT